MTRVRTDERKVPGITTITAKRDASEVSKPGPVTSKFRILDSESREEGNRTDEEREPVSITLTAEKDANEVGKPGPVTPKHRIVDSEMGEVEIVTTVGEVRVSRFW